MHSNIILCTLFFVAFAVAAPSYFVPYGPSAGDSTLYPNDDGSSDAISFDFIFFGVHQDTLFVNNNGDLTFEDAMWTYTPEGMSAVQLPCIAPYFSDVDTRSNNGHVYYRIATDASEMAAVSSFVSSTQSITFSGTRMFVATWDQVGYYYIHTDKLNTFQAVLIADDLGNTFTLFNYGQLQWTTGDASGGSGGLGGVPASAGFSDGTQAEGHYASISVSLTAGVLQLNQMSNVAINGVSQTGQFVFRTNTVVVIPPSPPATTCGNGIVESGEDCDGGSCCTSACSFTSVNTICRVSDGNCDVAEVCTGSSAECPSDAFIASSVVCRPSAGICDVAESCTGAGASCPADSFMPTTTPCNETFGVCDLNLNRYCSGNSAQCSGAPIPSLNANVKWPAYNVISFGAATGNTGNVGGRMAARNDISFGAGFSVGSEVQITLKSGNGSPASSLFYSLIGGHNVNWVSGNLFPDDVWTEAMYVGDTFTGSSDLAARVLGNNTANGHNLDADFDNAQSYYAALSANLALETSNVDVSMLWGALILNCSNDASSTGRYIVDLTESELSSSTWIDVDASCNYGASWLFNIRGTGDVVFQGGNFPGIGERVLYNVIGSGRQITVSTLVNGNILAPQCTYNQQGGVTSGLVIVGSISMISSAENPNCAAFRPFDIVVLTAGNSPSRSSQTVNQAGNSNVAVDSFSQIIVNDSCTISGDSTVYTVVQRVTVNGQPELVITPALVKTVGSGSTVTCHVANPYAARPQDTIVHIVDNNSSSTTIFVSIALIAFALMF